MKHSRTTLLIRRYFFVFALLSAPTLWLGCAGESPLTDLPFDEGTTEDDPEPFDRPPIIASQVVISELDGQCYARDLEVDDAGRVPCELYELQVAAPNTIFEKCENIRRRPVESNALEGLLNWLEENGRCGGASTTSCADYQVCAAVQLKDEALSSCQFDVREADEFEHPGYCYIDEDLLDAAGATSPLIESCPTGERQLIRLVGDVMATDAIRILVCTDEVAKINQIPLLPRD